jgi:hypothetical protein
MVETRMRLPARLAVLCVLAMLLPRDAGAQLRAPQVPISGAALQTYLTNVGESIDVQTSQASIQWLNAIASGFNFTIQLDFSVGSGGSSVGIYDATAGAPILFEVFPPYASAGWFALVQFRTSPTRVIINLFDSQAALNRSTTLFGGNRNAVGFYLDGPGGRFYSQDARNPAAAPQVLWFAGTGLNSCSWWIAFEDTSLSAGADADFDDVILYVAGVSGHLCPTSVQRSTWGTLKTRFR